MGGAALEVTFLGTAGSFPSADRNLSAVAVKRKGELILFDCGEGTQQRISRAKLGFKSRTKIFVSHLHGDHILGIPGILQTLSLFDRQSPLKVYGPTGLGAFIKCILETVRFSLSFSIEVYEVGEGVVCQENEYTVRAAWVEHSVPCLAYALVESSRPGRFYPEKATSLGVSEGPLWSKLQSGVDITLPSGRVVQANEVVGPTRQGRKLVYAVDTRPCEAALELAQGADLLIHEATLDDGLAEKAYESYHSTPSQAADIARRAGAKRLVLTHISGRYNSLDGFLDGARKIFPATQAAEDLMIVKIPYTE